VSHDGAVSQSIGHVTKGTWILSGIIIINTTPVTSVNYNKNSNSEMLTEKNKHTVEMRMQDGKHFKNLNIFMDKTTIRIVT